MHIVVGTVPIQDFPLVSGEVSMKGNMISIGENLVSINRGTPALLAAAIKTSEYLDLPAPCAYLAGDIGLGQGSIRLYEYIARHLGKSDSLVITFHYLLPNIDGHNKVLFAIEEMTSRPILIADAGYMYAAKMSGQSTAYDLFTPDIGELAFLADEMAPHPFYTRGFILHDENRVPELINRSYEHKNAARYLLVKGEKDYVVSEKGIAYIIDSPLEEAMEAIGGTGDTLTGIVSALISKGIEIEEASFIAARANRLAGHYAKPTPATQITEIISHIPKALEDIFLGNNNIEAWGKVL
ncbi:MAG TPA: NAD(P)H-hydrate dehydratase [Desulfatiglandales bacterium]|nr:NAD(P)H-hydrate dehydratase [Desulfatiglandales bacterium]